MPKWQAVRFGLSNVARRERCTAGAQSGPNPSCGRCGTWKSRISYPALVVPRQANRKAGPGETAWRGSKKPRPVCNGSDMPTSIWSFVVKNSMEPFLLRKANDDRRPSIGASQTRHKDCRASRPLISMAKVESGSRSSWRACPTGTFSTEWCPLKGLSRVKGNFHARF